MPRNQARTQDRQRVLMAAWETVFNSLEGQMVLRDLLRLGGVLHTTHVAGDPYHSAFQEGRRALALEVLQKLRWSEMELIELAKQTTDQTLAPEARAEEQDMSADPFALMEGDEP